MLWLLFVELASDDEEVDDAEAPNREVAGELVVFKLKKFMPLIGVVAVDENVEADSAA